jgi:NADH dehydrogenase FAD-containing subunit
MRNRTFKTPGLSEENHVFFMKNLWDARRVRSRLLECFERASNPVLAADEVKRLLTFVIVGGGPTSVEFAGELANFAARDAKAWYPDLY